MKMVVAKDGSGDFTTIQDAIEAMRVLPLEPVTIYVKNGVYEEKVVVPDNKWDLTLIGESKEGTVITYADHAAMRDERGNKIGTFRTPTFTVLADNFRMENMTLVNAAGYGEGVGQALALYASGDKLVFKNCRFLGNQDTIYTSKGRQYFVDCYIEGHVDFIFGSATAVFQNCEIHSLRRGYITAASTPKDVEFGYVFFDCKLTGVADEGSVYLGRPWRPYGHTIFVRTWMGPHIHPEGWHNWRNPDNERTARYAEYGSTGPGANPDARVPWSRQLTEEEVKELTLERIFRGSNNWVPEG